jgi:pyruvate-ferredoxin/flavodoxin oxidoreductase
MKSGIFLLNSPLHPEEVWQNLPKEIQKGLIEKNARLFTIDAQKVATETGSRRINTVMQACFFSISEVLPKEKAIAAIKDSIQKTYGKKGSRIVDMNLMAVDNSLNHLHEIPLPKVPDSKFRIMDPVPENSPEFVKNVLGKIIGGAGDEVPVSAFPVDGTYPVGTAQYEKRNIALKIPVWDEEICIQCGKCMMVCPHSVIRANVYDPNYLDSAPKGFKYTDSREKEWKEKGLKYTIQVSPEDCTGCSVCVEVCPVKNKSNVSLKA